MKTRAPPLWLLALITFSGTLAMHIFIPGLSYAARDLGASIGEMQLTVSLYILGLAVGQLVYGPLSDRFGRRRVLMVGLALYTVAGLVAALASQTHTLIAARLFQGFGGCAGMVLGRAMVRDTGNTEESAKRMALLVMVVSIGPGLAPLVGGALASALGWRSIFYLLCAMGGAALLCSWRLLPETRKTGVDTDTTTLLRNYRELLRSRAFLGYAIGGGCSTTASYAFIAAAPFIFVDQLHRPAYEVGIYLTTLVFGASLGAAMTSRLIGRISIPRLLLRANATSAAAAIVLLLAAVSEHLSVAWVVGAMFVVMFGSGMSGPASVTQSIGVNPRVIGSASGLYGFTQMVIGALCTTMVGVGDSPALAAAVILVATTAFGQLCYWLAMRAN